MAVHTVWARRNTERNEKIRDTIYYSPVTAMRQKRHWNYIWHRARELNPGK